MSGGDAQACSTVCVYCSVPHGVEALLKGVRKLHPDAEITAIVPPGYVWTSDSPCPADQVIPATFGLGRLRNPGALYRFVADLRTKRFDLVLTQFESIRLRVFCAVVRPRAAKAWLPTMEMRPLSTCLVATLFDLARLRARGYGRICVALIHAYILPEKPRVKVPKR